jgi:hypothetical protein
MVKYILTQYAWGMARMKLTAGTPKKNAHCPFDGEADVIVWNRLFRFSERRCTRKHEKGLWSSLALSTNPHRCLLFKLQKNVNRFNLNILIF